MNNNDFVKQLHPVTLMIYFALLCVMAMTLNHPLYLCALFCAMAATIVLLGAWKAWRNYLLWSAWMMIFIVGTNVLISHNGATILYRGTTLPVLGRILISQEAIFYGLVMALKLALVLSAFCLLNAVLQADRVISLFMRSTPKSALTVILTSMTLPRMKRNFYDIKIAMQCRGAVFHGRNVWQRVQAQYPLLKVMLLSSLEDSWQIAEALFARGFLSGKRSFYRTFSWQLRDGFILGGVLIAFFVFLMGMIKQRMRFQFYPTMDEILWRDHVSHISWLVAGLMVLPATDLLWKKWKFIRLKI